MNPILTKQHLMIAALGAGIIVSTILVIPLPNAYAKHLRDNQRYHDGFNDGSNAARADRENGNQFNPACDPTAHFCMGWTNRANLNTKPAARTKTESNCS